MIYTQPAEGAVLGKLLFKSNCLQLLVTDVKK